MEPTLRTEAKEPIDRKLNADAIASRLKQLKELQHENALRQLIVVAAVIREPRTVGGGDVRAWVVSRP